jgi:hypothetical protein
MSKIVKWSLPALAFAMMVGVAGIRAQAQEGAGAAAQGKVTGVIHNEDGTPAANVTVRLVAASKIEKKADKEAEKEAGKGGAKPQAADEGTGAAKQAEEDKKKPERPKAVAEGKTDAAGKFELEAPAGKYTVMANMRGQGRVQKTVELKAGKTEDVGTLTLKKPAPKKEGAPATPAT